MGMKRNMIEQRTLSDYITILRKNKKLLFLSLLIFLFSAIIYNNVATPKYQTKIRIEIKTSPVNNLFYGNYWFDYFSKEREFNSHTKMLKSYVIAKKICDRINIKEIIKKEKKKGKIFGNLNISVDNNPHKGGITSNLPDPWVIRVMNDITVKQIPDTNLVDIYVTDSNPEICYKVASVIADVYQEELSQMKLSEVKKTISVLTRQLISIKEELSKSEEKYIKFLNKSGNPFFKNNANISLDRLSDLKVELTKQKIEKVSVENELNYLRKVVRENIDSIINEPVLSEDKEIISLKNRLFNLKLQLEDLKAKYREKHPLVVSKKNEIKDLENALTQKIRSLIKAKENKLKILNAKIAELSKIIKENEVRAVKNSSLEMEYKSIKDELESNKTLYETLLNKIKTLDISKTFNANYIYKLSYPIYPSTPISPNKILNIIVSLFMGLIFGVSAVFLMEFARTNITSPEEIEADLGITALSPIPKIEEKKRDINEYYLNEHFKMIKAEILLKFREEKFLLLVTSTLPKEGKSFVALNLARLFAKDGKRTLLINLDLRRPVLNKYFKTEKEGISELLISPQKAIPESGSLSEYPLSDILYLLYVNRKNSIIKINCGEENFEIHIINGTVALITSNKKEENLLLGNLLVNLLGMKKDVVDAGIRNSIKSGEKLGEYLLNSGLISSDKIAEVLVHQFQAIFIKILKFEKATFTISDNHPGFYNPQIIKFLEKKMGVFFETMYFARDYDKLLKQLHIYKTEEANLFFLPSGTTKVNPNEIIVSEKINDLFKIFKKHFDIVIVDSPPAGIVAESNLLLPYADGIIYVIKYKSTHKKHVMASIEKIEKNSGKILGAILNFVDIKKEKSSFTYYSTYHRYDEKY